MTLNKNKHKINIEKFLLSIMNSKIWDYLAFKWWTLVYLKYWLDRFSTDLDFDLIKFISKNYSERTILWWLWEVIDEKLKQRIKVKLIPETLELLNKLINSLS